MNKEITPQMDAQEVLDIVESELEAKYSIKIVPTNNFLWKILKSKKEDK